MLNNIQYLRPILSNTCDNAANRQTTRICIPNQAFLALFTATIDLFVLLLEPMMFSDILPAQTFIYIYLFGWRSHPSSSAEYNKSWLKSWQWRKHHKGGFPQVHD